jgi:hypothetical protein
VLLADAERHPPRFGDVVLARNADGLRLHRLVWAPRRSGRSWRTQADVAPLFDRRVSRSDVLATVLLVEGRKGSPRRVTRAAASLLRSLLACLSRLIAPRAG